MYDFEVGQEVIVISQRHRNPQPYPAKIVSKGRKYFKVQLHHRRHDMVDKMEIGTNFLKSPGGYSPYEYVYHSVEAYNEYVMWQKKCRKIQNTAQYFNYQEISKEDLEILARIFKVDFSDTPT
jgi:hypothetical protein